MSELNNFQNELFEIIIKFKNNQIKNDKDMLPLRKYIYSKLNSLKFCEKDDIYNQFLFNIYQSNFIPKEYQVFLFIKSRLNHILIAFGEIKDDRYKSKILSSITLIEEYFD